MLTYTMPFRLLLLAWVFPGERLKGAHWPAVAIAFAGLIIVLGPWRGQGVTSSFLAVGGGLSWTGGTVVAKHLQRRHTGTSSRSPRGRWCSARSCWSPSRH